VVFVLIIQSKDKDAYTVTFVENSFKNIRSIYMVYSTLNAF